jgi:hypothetical protein
MEPVTHRNGKRYYELTVRSHGEYVIYQMRCSFYLAFGTTGRTEASFLATKSNDLLFLTALADKS